MVSKHTKDPIIFQGKNKSENYFEGWYFKQVSPDLKSIISIIPGISKGNLDPHAFIQSIITYEHDKNTILKTHYHRFSKNEFKYTEEPFCLTIGNNAFKNEGIKLDLENDEYSIQGSINFSKFTKIKRNMFFPTAMGLFTYLPFMECYHDIISMSHNIYGVLTVNSKAFDFNNGKGYIEKDWGTSFPKEYVWLQSNHFDGTDTSIMFSLAHIPFLGASFQGFICNFTYNNQEYRFATYNNSKIECVNYSGGRMEVIIVRGVYKMIIIAETGQDSAALKAPIKGNMDIMIKEGLSGLAEIKLLKNSKTLFIGKGNPCAIEIHIKEGH